MMFPLFFSLLLNLFFGDTSSVQSLHQSMDALSVTLPAETATADIRYKIDGEWSGWETLSVDNEQDPLLRESNLAIFPKTASEVEIRGEVEHVNPVTISKEPVRFAVAATTNTDTPRVLSRSEWGADDSLLYPKKTPSSPVITTDSPPTGDNGGTTSARVQECEDAQLNYPDEFKVKRRTTTDDAGNTLLWTREYSKDIKVIAVHHTAIAVEGDERSGVERMRALYQYHSVNRGWGDIGYHFLIDEDGQIYEGKSGGKYIVAGHAYCNNINTLGVALLGNFEIEQPSQKQLKALQWLLGDLAEEYDIDVTRDVKHHGKTMPAIVGHRDLVSTTCPGYYAYGALDQIRKHVADGDYDASVKLPKMPSSSSSKRSKSTTSKRTIPGQASSGTPRRVQRVLESEASRILRRKLGSNPGREVEEGVTKRLANRLGKSSSSRRSVSSRSISRSSVSRSRASSVRSSANTSGLIRIRLVSREHGERSCNDVNLEALKPLYRGKVECQIVEGLAAIINEVELEDYLMGLAEEPDTEPYEKQRAFAIAARTYAAYYRDSGVRKFPGKPYDGSDSPATFQKYTGISFEEKNPNWLKAVASTKNDVLTYGGKVIRPPYFSSDDGRTRTPEEAGWGTSFPFAEIYYSKEDPWCEGMAMAGHGVGMSGCGSEGQANEGKSAEEILEYYYPGTLIKDLR